MVLCQTCDCFLPTVPDAPTNFSVSTVSSTSAFFTWEPPLETNGILTGYYLQTVLAAYKQTENTDMFSLFMRFPANNTLQFSSITSFANLSGLHPFSQYKIQLQAATRKGHGTASILVIDTKPSGQPYNNPECSFYCMLYVSVEPAVSARNVKATSYQSAGGVGVNLSWIPPRLINRNSIITHYRIMYIPVLLGSYPQPGFVTFGDLTTNTGQEEARHVEYVGMKGDRSYYFSLSACTNSISLDSCGPEEKVSVHTLESGTNIYILT